MATYYNHIEEEEEEEDEDDYIDMELGSFSNFFFHSTNTTTSPQAIEFEFQMCSSSDQENESTILTADQLFYKGKLLPLHHPHRLQMLQNSTSLPQSCTVSEPSDSFRLTADYLNDYFNKWSTEVSDDHFIDVEIPKKSWSKKKIKLIKKFLVGQTLKQVKSLFSKSNCSNESCVTKADVKGEAGNKLKGKNDNLSKHINKKILEGHIGNEATFPSVANVMKLSSNEKVRLQDTYNISHRKSFSGAIKQPSSSSSSRSSSSTSSSMSFDTSSNSSGIELGTIESAIAHCKMSRHNMLAEAEYWSFSVSRTADCIRDQET